MKKNLCLLIALLLLLSACGKKTVAESAAQSGSSAAQSASLDEAAEQENAQTQESTQTQEPVKNEVKESEPVHPYSWLGLSDMPECNYLDILSSNHYYQVYDVYDADGKTETAEAADGIDSYLMTAQSRNLALSGMFYYINEEEKTVTQYDYTESAVEAQAYMESVLAEGTNMKGRVFNDTGSSAIPLYADQTGDTAEYEYYEYLISNPGVNEITERFFMKYGDVFAIYTKTVADSSTTESTNVIKSITADIPAGIFEVPDLSEYNDLS